MTLPTTCMRQSLRHELMRRRIARLSRKRIGDRDARHRHTTRFIHRQLTSHVKNAASRGGRHKCRCSTQLNVIHRHRVAIACEALVLQNSHQDVELARPNRCRNIFLHSGWRCGHTYVWSKFRELDGVIAYYEPFHEDTAKYTAVFVRTHAADAWNSRHPPAMRPYALEYAPLLGATGVPTYREDFALAGYFPRRGGAFPEATYLRDLQDHAWQQDKTAVFGFSRSLGRVGSIKSRFTGRHIVLVRDPVQQWLSCRSYRVHEKNSYFELGYFLILALAPQGTLAADLAGEFGLPRVPHGPFAQQQQFVQRAIQPWSDELSFRAFLSVYVLSLMNALPYADLVIDMDHMGRYPLYRDWITLACEELTGYAPNFRDCSCPMHDSKVASVRFDRIGPEVLERLATCGIDQRWNATNAALAQAQSLVVNKVLSSCSQRWPELSESVFSSSWVQQTCSRFRRTLGI